MNKKDLKWCIEQLKNSKLHVTVRGREYKFENECLVDMNVMNRTIALLEGLKLKGE